MFDVASSIGCEGQGSGDGVRGVHPFYLFMIDVATSMTIGCEGQGSGDGVRGVPPFYFYMFE